MEIKGNSVKLREIKGNSQTDIFIFFKHPY